MKLRLVLAYHGAAFCGWQSQAGGGSVQDAVEAAFSSLCGGERIVVHGAGRTDAGVHADGQCAHAEVPGTRLALADWRRALNAHLPAEVRVMKVAKAGEGFHARFSAVGKVYSYRIWNGPVCPPLMADRVWHVPWTLDGQRLREACGAFVGTHDFCGFSARRSKTAETTVRTLRAVRVARRGELLKLTFEGEGFLYKMARMLAAAAVRCAAGRVGVDDLRRVLREAGPKTSHVAPACGLCLVRVRY